MVDQSTARMSTSAQDRSVEVSRPRVLFVIEGRGDATAEFHRFASPRTADALLKRLPVQGRAAIYGEEVYFKVPVKAPAEKPRSTMEVGSIGYWPFSPVNLLGRVTGGLELFRSIKEGTMIEIRKA